MPHEPGAAVRADHDQVARYEISADITIAATAA